MIHCQWTSWPCVVLAVQKDEELVRKLKGFQMQFGEPDMHQESLKQNNDLTFTEKSRKKFEVLEAFPEVHDKVKAGHLKFLRVVHS